METLVTILARFLSRGPKMCMILKILRNFKRTTNKSERKTKNKRQQRLDQRTFYAGAVRANNQAITF